MELNRDVMQAVESLGYRVTVGDVAAKTGLDLSHAQAGVLALASETKAHMQVAETGDIAYEFPRQFRALLRNKYWQLRWQETWAKIWNILFYLIRISFGILLVVSIVLIFVAIIAIQIGMQQRDDDNQGSYGGSIGFNPWLWIGRDWFYWFSYGPQPRYSSRRSYPGQPRPKSELNFLESIYSFLFGDGDPNSSLDERRWSAIATLIRNHKGAVTAEQLAPYLDGANLSDENEDYVIPVLSRFNGFPKVSPDGDLVYYFPELQVMAQSRRAESLPAYLQEIKRRFTSASSGQVTLAIGLGLVNLVGALYLGGLLQGGADFTGIVGLVQSVYWLLLGYGAAFLGIPTVRYFWLQWQNSQIESRNQQRRQLVGRTVPRKLTYARQFAAETVVDQSNLAYTTETDLIDQEIEQRDKLDAEWAKRLEQGNS